MADLTHHPRYRRTLAFLAAHPVIESLLNVAVGMLAFMVLVYPVLRVLAWLGDNHVELPYWGSYSMRYANLALWIACFFGPSLIASGFFVRFMARSYVPAIKALRAGAAKA